MARMRIFMVFLLSKSPTLVGCTVVQTGGQTRFVFSTN